MIIYAYPRSKHIRRSKLIVRRAGREYMCDDCGNLILKTELHGHGRQSINGVLVPRQFCLKCVEDVDL